MVVPVRLAADAILARQASPISGRHERRGARLLCLTRRR